jgi:hypothetical protein
MGLIISKSKRDMTPSNSTIENILNIGTFIVPGCLHAMGPTSHIQSEWDHHHSTGRARTFDSDIPSDPGDHDGLSIHA